MKLPTVRQIVLMLSSSETRTMVADLRNSFRVSFIMSEAPTPIPSALELLTQVQSQPVWDGASISPEGAQFPFFHVDWHEGHGFVLQCYEDEESWSDFLVTSQNFSAPSNRSGAWRAGAGTMAARVVRFGGADHPGPQSFFEVRQARPGPQVGQNRYFSTRN